MTGLPNPSTNFLINIGKVQGHGRQTKVGQSTSDRMTNVCLLIGNASFNLPTPSSNGTCGHGLVSPSGKMEPFRFLWGGGMMRLCKMPATNSFPDGPIHAPLMVATFPFCTMRYTNSSYASLVCATRVATSPFLCTMPNANSSLDDLVCGLLECLTAACKALSLANAKGKGTNGSVIRSLDD